MALNEDQDQLDTEELESPPEGTTDNLDQLDLERSPAVEGPATPVDQAPVSVQPVDPNAGLKELLAKVNASKALPVDDSAGQAKNDLVSRALADQQSAKRSALFSRLGEGLAEGLSTAGGGQYKANNSYADALDASADDSIKQIGEGSKLSVQVDKDDPKSEISGLYRDTLSKIIKTPVPEGISASKLESMFPILKDFNPINKVAGSGVSGRVSTTPIGYVVRAGTKVPVFAKNDGSLVEGGSGAPVDSKDFHALEYRPGMTIDSRSGDNVLISGDKFGNNKISGLHNSAPTPTMVPADPGQVDASGKPVKQVKDFSALGIPDKTNRDIEDTRKSFMADTTDQRNTVASTKGILDAIDLAKTNSAEYGKLGPQLVQVITGRSPHEVEIQHALSDAGLLNIFMNKQQQLKDGTLLPEYADKLKQVMGGLKDANQKNIASKLGEATSAFGTNHPEMTQQFDLNTIAKHIYGKATSSKAQQATAPAKKDEVATYGADVVKYAKEHNITDEQALAIKKQRTGQ